MLLIVKQKGGHQGISIKPGVRWEFLKVLPGRTEGRIVLRVRGRRFLLFRLLTLWTDGVTNLDLIRDSVTAATALYLPYRLAYHVTGTHTGGAVGALLILLWVSTWIGDHELLGRLLIIGGYVIDFGPCIYRMLVSQSR